MIEDTINNPIHKNLFENAEEFSKLFRDYFIKNQISFNYETLSGLIKEAATKGYIKNEETTLKVFEKLYEINTNIQDILLRASRNLENLENIKRLISEGKTSEEIVNEFKVKVTETKTEIKTLQDEVDEIKKSNYKETDASEVYKKIFNIAKKITEKTQEISANFMTAVRVIEQSGLISDVLDTAFLSDITNEK
jgi:hypothetical protein